MGFSENLKNIRREKNLSQEQLAELLNVSRQAISKWEQDGSYPETEKLIQLAQKLDISLDTLLLDKQPENAVVTATPQNNTAFSGERKIAVKSFDGSTLSTFYKFAAGPVIAGGKKFPKFCLSGTDHHGFWGDSGVILGWYATMEDAQKEVNEIHKAMQNGETEYQLKYYVNLEDYASVAQRKYTNH
ncbi:MAG: helix-turn-helix domain-containing protein [Peptococcaceae bacterium]|nr:helix-turn-helix domain-containing protein [Peptococcaceae bacterium]